VGGERWFNLEVIRKVGIGNSTRFWKDPWRGEIPCCGKYPRLYAISNYKEATVDEVYRIHGERGEWEFGWRSNLFVWEEELLISLKEDLKGHRWGNHVDRWS